MTEPDIQAARKAADQPCETFHEQGLAAHVLALADALEQAKIREQAVLAEMDIPTTPETLVENIRSLVQKMRVEWTRASAWHAHWKDVSEKLEQAQAREAALRDEVRRRMLTEHYHGTNATDDPTTWICRACEWTWQDGQSENHDQGCPAALPTGGTGS